MRHFPLPALVFVGLLACTGFAGAQTGTPAAKPPSTPAADPPALAPATTSQPGSRSNQLIERIRVEGGTTQIDEVRVGGETRSITVQPRSGLPAYDVQPATGARAWKVFGF